MVKRKYKLESLIKLKARPKRSGGEDDQSGGVKPTEPEEKKGRSKALHWRLIATNNYFKKSYSEGVAVRL